MTDQDNERLTKHITQNAKEHKELSDKIDSVMAWMEALQVQLQQQQVQQSTIIARVDTILANMINRKPLVMQVLNWAGNNFKPMLVILAALLLLVGAVSASDIGEFIRSFFGQTPAGAE